MNLNLKQGMQNLKQNNSYSNFSKDESKHAVASSQLPINKQNFLKQNKSLEKYLAAKISNLDDLDTTNVYLSTNNLSTSVNVNSSLTLSTTNHKHKPENLSRDLTPNKTKSLFDSSSNKTIKRFAAEKLEALKNKNFLGHLGDDKKEKEDKENSFSLIDNLKSINNNFSSFAGNKNFELFQISSSEISEESQIYKRLGELKSGLIELINSTKDKNIIIKELDNIYLNIINLQNPLQRKHSKNQKFQQEFNEEDLGFLNSKCPLKNPHAGISNYIPTNTRESKICLNEDPSPLCNKELVLNIENKMLKSKIDELNGSLYVIQRENQELKRYIKDKSKNLELVENLLKKFEIELKNVKRKKAENVCSILKNNNNSNMNDSKIPSTSLLTKSNQRNSLLETNKKNDYSNYSNKSKINRTKLSPHSNKKVLFSNGKKYQINSSFNSISIPNTTNISSKYEQVFSYDNRNFNTSAIKPSKIQDDKFKEEEESPSILNTSLSVFQLEYPDYNSFVYSKINLNSENIISIPKLNFPIFEKQVLDTESEESPTKLQEESMEIMMKINKKNSFNTSKTNDALLGEKNENILEKKQDFID